MKCTDSPSSCPGVSKQSMICGEQKTEKERIPERTTGKGRKALKNLKLQDQVEKRGLGIICRPPQKLISAIVQFTQKL